MSAFPAPTRRPEPRLLRSLSTLERACTRSLWVCSPGVRGRWPPRRGLCRVLAPVSTSRSPGLTSLIILPQRHFRTHLLEHLNKVNSGFLAFLSAFVFHRLKSLEPEGTPLPTPHTVFMALAWTFAGKGWGAQGRWAWTAVSGCPFLGLQSPCSSSPLKPSSGPGQVTGQGTRHSGSDGLDSSPQHSPASSCRSPRRPGYLPNPGIEPGSPALQPDSLPSEPPGKPYFSMCLHTKEKTHVISISKSTEARRAIKNQILQLMTLDSNSICSSWLEVDVTVPD